MDRPNLFQFATSELSQDAFICWLASWAAPNYRSVDRALHTVGTVLLDGLLTQCGIPRPAAYHSVRVLRQWYDIDVLLEVNDTILLVIEDKTETSEHDGQLQRYADMIRQRHPAAAASTIAGIYLKTGDQSNYDNVRNARYGRFGRQELLHLLDQGRQAGVTSDIFLDFHRYLTKIEEEVQSYLTVPVRNWSSGLKQRGWTGFFMKLQEHLSGAKPEWGYVPNPRGGFMGFWWCWDGGKYLQLEQDKLCFKIEVTDRSQRIVQWDAWYTALIRADGTEGIRLKRAVRRSGQCMTVATYDGSYLQANSDGLLNLDGTLNTLRRAEALLHAASSLQYT